MKETLEVHVQEVNILRQAESFSSLQLPNQMDIFEPFEGFHNLVLPKWINLQYKELLIFII